MSGSIVRFGIFEADLKAGELRRNGVRIKLQDQPFQMLRLLLERHGEIVTRDDFRTLLWPSDTFVDFDHSLSAAMNKLREALGDSATNSRFIQTIPRRGYRFVAPPEFPQSLRDPMPVAPSRRWQRALLAAAISVGLVAISSVAVALWRMSNPSTDSQWNVVPLTSDPGIELEPSFSPDGNHIVYVKNLEGIGGQQHLHVKQISPESTRRLTSSTAIDQSPRWSPDGRQIAFVRVAHKQSSGPASIMVVPSFGGAERAIPNPEVTVRMFSGYSLLDWFKDSEHIVVADRATDAAALFVVNTRTGRRRQLTYPPRGGWGDLDPAVSPDGDSITFTRYGSIHSEADIYQLELTSELRPAREPRRLVADIASRGSAWMPNGRDIVFAAGPTHWKRLMRMTVDPPSSPRPLPFAAEGSFQLTAAVSKRNQIAYPIFRSRVQIYRTGLDRAGKAVRTSPFLRSTRISHLPEYSPSGDHIAFVSDRSGPQEIWISKADGSDQIQLTQLQGKPAATWPRWSPDGRRLAFTGGSTAWIVDVNGGTPLLLAREEPGLLACEWSTDGKWIYLLSARTGRDEIWIVPVDGRQGNSKDRQITKNGGGVPMLSPDGDFLYYATRSVPSQLWRIPPQGGREERVVPHLANDGTFTVTADGVYFISPVDNRGRAGIWLLKPGTGEPERIASVDNLPMWGLALSPDGRSILHAAAESSESDLMLAENVQ